MFTKSSLLKKNVPNVKLQQKILICEENVCGYVSVLLVIAIMHLLLVVEHILQLSHLNFDYIMYPSFEQIHV